MGELPPFPLGTILVAEVGSVRLGSAVAETCDWSTPGVLREGDRRVAKDAMRCARLGMQGVELLVTGRLELPITGERGEWLRAVRRGEVGGNEWSARVSCLDDQLARLTTETAIPTGPDRPCI